MIGWGSVDWKFGSNNVRSKLSLWWGCLLNLVLARETVVLHAKAVFPTSSQSKLWLIYICSKSSKFMDSITDKSTSSPCWGDSSAWIWLLLTHGFLSFVCLECFLHNPEKINFPVISIYISWARSTWSNAPFESQTACGKRVAWSAPSRIWVATL